MKFDSTITLAVVVSLATIIAPILTTIINNRYQLKSKKLEEKQHIYSSCEEYISILGAYIEYDDAANLVDYKKKLSIALIYADNKSCELMLKADSYMQQKKFAEARSMLPTIATSLRQNTFKMYKRK